MIVVDTNVVSELSRVRPAPEVLSWYAEQRAGDLFLSVVSAAEMLAGVLCMTPGARRDVVERGVVDALETQFAGRVLAFGAATALEYAGIVRLRTRLGRPVATADAMIAATALATGASLATRNVRDFEGVGLEVIDPWSA